MLRDCKADKPPMDTGPRTPSSGSCLQAPACMGSPILERSFLYEEEASLQAGDQNGGSGPQGYRGLSLRKIASLRPPQDSSIPEPVSVDRVSASCLHLFLTLSSPLRCVSVSKPRHCGLSAAPGARVSQVSASRSVSMHFLLSPLQSFLLV